MGKRTLSSAHSKNKKTKQISHKQIQLYQKPSPKQRLSTRVDDFAVKIKTPSKKQDQLGKNQLMASHPAHKHEKSQLAPQRSKKERVLSKFNIVIPSIAKKTQEMLKQKEERRNCFKKKQESQLYRSVEQEKDEALLWRVAEKIVKGWRNSTIIEEFETGIQKHMKMMFLPIPLSSFGARLLKDGKFLLAYYGTIVRTETNPFLLNYVFNFIECKFRITTNREFFTREHTLNNKRLEEVIMKMKSKQQAKL